MPTKTISSVKLRALRAARNNVGNVDSGPPGEQAEGMHGASADSHDASRTTTLRQETLEQFIKEASPLPIYRVAMLWFSLLTGLLLSTKETSIGASTARLVSDNLGDSTADDLWIALIPSLVYASLCSTFATLSSLIGRRSSVLISLALFGLASVACGSATTFQSLVVAQVAQSVGGTGLYCMAMIVIPDVTPVSLVPLLPAVMGSTAVAGSLLGPVVGGMLAESGNWRWFFWINAPIASLAAVIFAAACPERTRGEELGKQKLGLLDWKGCLLTTATCGFLVFGLAHSAFGVPTWNSLVHSASLQAGLVCGTLSLTRHAKTVWRDGRAIAPMLPLHVITNPVLLAQIALSLLAGCSYTFLTIMLPTRFVVSNFLTIPEMVLHMAPFVIAFAIGTSTCGLLLKRPMFTSIRPIIGWVLVFVGNGLLMAIDDDYDVDPKMSGYLMLVGLGTGIACASCTFGATLHCRAQDTAIVQGLVAQARVHGGLFATAGFSSIFNRQLLSHLGGELTAEQIVRIPVNHRSLDSLTTLQKYEVRRNFMAAFSETVGYVAVSATVGIGISIFVSRQRTYNVERKAREVEGLLVELYKSKLYKSKLVEAR